MKMINQFEQNGAYLYLCSHIDEKLFDSIDTENIESIAFNGEYDDDWKPSADYPSKEDLRCLNAFVKANRQIMVNVYKSYGMIPFLPDVERFQITRFDDEAIELLKNSAVKGLHIHHSADTKKDLTALLPFGDTLEYLYLDAGQYKPYINFEAMLNGMKKLKTLKVTSIKMDFSLIDENSSLEYFYFYGSKTKELNGITKFPRLKTLRLKANSVLSDIDFLKDLHCLEEIDFQYCSQITRFPDLSHLKNLKKIYALECNRIDDIEELKKLNDVEIWVQGKAVPGKCFEKNRADE